MFNYEPMEPVAGFTYGNGPVHNNFAHFACLAGDREVTARLTARVSEPIREAWAKDATLFARCRDWANGKDESGPPGASAFPASSVINIDTSPFGRAP